jgi:hypothetical protein
LQNSFNPTSSNSEIPIIWHLRRNVPRLEVLLFNRKKASSMKHADLRHMFKKDFKSICTPTVVVSPDPLSHTPQISSVVKNPEKTDESEDPEPAD